MSNLKTKGKRWLMVATLLLLFTLVYVVINRKYDTNFMMRYRHVHVRHFNHSNIEVVVYGDGYFMEGLPTYNTAIGDERSKLLNARLNMSWQPLKSPVTVISARDNDFYKGLQQQNLTTLYLLCGHSKSSKHIVYTKRSIKLLVQRYYEWTASKPFCRWIKTSRSKYRPDMVKSNTCDMKTTNTVELEQEYVMHKHIDIFDVDGKSGNDLGIFSEQMDAIFFLNLIENAIITKIGDVFSHSLKLLPHTCREDKSTAHPKGSHSSYKELFIITQYWGTGFFHFMLEDLPRLVPYLQFLKANPSIKIHVQSKNKFTLAILGFLGIHQSRLVAGVVRSSLVYLPQGTPCGRPHVQQTQLLSELLRNITHVKFHQKVRKSIVLIQRSGHRHLRFANKIKELIKLTATSFGYRFELFSDNPLPALDETAQIFNRAVMIVGPHGAGLSNMLFSHPGTYLIEGICNPPHINLCYQWIAHILGHRYHAVPSRQGCENVVDIEPNVIARVVKHYLKMIK